MKALDTLQHNPLVEEIVTLLCKKTQNYNPTFFRLVTVYYLTKLASMMRVSILTKDRGRIPINIYAINLANSGLGKGHSTNIIEDDLINRFRTTFFESTYPYIVERALNNLSSIRANNQNKDFDETLMAVQREFDEAGALPFSFDSGTTAAIKQMRHKLLMSTIGSMNLEIDEIGSNLLSNAEVLTTFLELFDVGKVKQKLTKNTKDNTRNEELEGKTPTNLMLFGTPSKLLNGGKVEDEFYSFLETGYARRSFFGYTRYKEKVQNITAEQIYDTLVDTSLNKAIKDISIKLNKLAHRSNFNKSLLMDKAVSIILIKYRMYCEKVADHFGEHEEIRKAEMEHRYFKAIKLAGTYAFLDNSPVVGEKHLYAAIKMAEESGESFDKIHRRERNYTKLAKYLADTNHEVTHVDLTEDLPFYRGSMAAKNELMQLATAWGYKNHIVIKRIINNGIEFIQGETLKKTELSSMTLAYSDQFTEGYQNVKPNFFQLHKLTQAKNKHWVSHHLKGGYRNEDHVIPGFNLIVLDIDKNVSIKTAKLLMQKYTYLLHTTKRHTATHNRFRLILPINYNIDLNGEDFKEFMENVYAWLPFEVDTQTNQCSRKWASFDQGHHEYNDTDVLIDALLFIPKTAKNDECKQLIQSQQSLTNLERWFIHNTEAGNRNNKLLRYALILVDMGLSKNQILNKIIKLNDKFENKLTEDEIKATIMITVNNKLNGKGVS